MIERYFQSQKEFKSSELLNIAFVLKLAIYIFNAKFNFYTEKFKFHNLILEKFKLRISYYNLYIENIVLCLRRTLKKFVSSVFVTFALTTLQTHTLGNSFVVSLLPGRKGSVNCVAAGSTHKYI